jgi:hypothetical protein
MELIDPLTKSVPPFISIAANGPHIVISASWDWIANRVNDLP